jgi:hypothetical protein
MEVVYLAHIEHLLEHPLVVVFVILVFTSVVDCLVVHKEGEQFWFLRRVILLKHGGFKIGHQLFVLLLG